MPSCLLPRILAFDTASQRGSVALLQGPEVLAELKLHTLQTHSIHLMRSIDFLLDRLGWALQDINLVAAGIGPGSFTGIRIGIATALGIAQALSVPFAGIDGFEAIARQAALSDGRIGVLLNAQRSQIYYAEYIGRRGKIQLARKPSLVFLRDLERCLANRHLYIVGDCEECWSMKSSRSETGWPRRIAADLFLAPGIGRSAFLRKRKWRSGEFITCDPLYIRPPDALRKQIGER
jgi:tRNA threonylcarbamoyladenosine biosynthesis protein TsaB